MIRSVVIFVLGFFVLIKGSDYFVEYASKIAKRIGVSDFVIGMSVVAIGTSLPEISNSVIASMAGRSMLALGIVVGSNIANICLILGVAVLIAGKIDVVRKIFSMQEMILMLSAAILLLFSLNHVISRLEGGLLLMLFCGYMIFGYGLFSQFRDLFSFRGFLDSTFRLRGLFSLQNYQSFALSLWRHKNSASRKQVSAKSYQGFLSRIYILLEASILGDLAILTLGGLAVLYGTEYMVSGAVDIAAMLGVSEGLFGLSLIAVGTSLPELSVSISAAKRGYPNILLGNIIGSNITNTFLVGGLAAAITPISLPNETVLFTLPSMLLISVLFALFLWTGRKVSRLEGILLILIYIMFLAARIILFG